MANFTTESYGKHIEQNLNKFINSSAGFQEAIFKLVSMSEKRIFDKGKGGNGADIGKYSTKPLYVNPTLPTNRKKFPVRGKESNQKTFKNGKPRKTAYFANYTAYKQSQGMALLGNKVNLQVKKNFRRAFLTKSFPITHNATEVIAQMGIPPSAANPIGKIVGLMNKYPNAFKFTKAERKFIIDELRNLFIQSLRA